MRVLANEEVTQRRVLYLGESNDSQQTAWRKTREVFDQQQQQYTRRSLFPEDRPVPAEAGDTIQVKLSEMKLRRARPYGDCWLGCELWRQLELDRFWEQKLERGREEVSWAQVLELLVVNRLIDPGSEFRLHRNGSIKARWTCCWGCRRRPTRSKPNRTRRHSGTSPIRIRGS